MPFANVKLVGRSGEEIHDRWNREGAPSAYAGMATHDMPNFCTSCEPVTFRSTDRIRYDHGTKHTLWTLLDNNCHVRMPCLHSLSILFHP